MPPNVIKQSVIKQSVIKQSVIDGQYYLNYFKYIYIFINSINLIIQFRRCLFFINRNIFCHLDCRNSQLQETKNRNKHIFQQDKGYQKYTFYISLHPLGLPRITQIFAEDACSRCGCNYKLVLVIFVSQ